MRGLRKYLTPFAPDQYLYYMNLAGSSSSVMPVAVPETSVDLMSRAGLRAKVHCSVRVFAIWMRSSDGMTVWWQNLQMQ